MPSHSSLDSLDVPCALFINFTRNNTSFEATRTDKYSYRRVFIYWYLTVRHNDMK